MEFEDDAFGEPLPREAFLELQNHGNTLYFKNLSVRELPL